MTGRLIPEFERAVTKGILFSGIGVVEIEPELRAANCPSRRRIFSGQVTGQDPKSGKPFSNLWVVGGQDQRLVCGAAWRDELAITDL